MFIVWGKKPVTRRLGYVADFCPICRDLRTFTVKRVGLADHIYYVSFGEGRLVGHTRTCTACDIDLNARPEIYKELHARKLPPPQLAALTRPGWEQAHAARLAVERDLISPFGKVAPDIRQALIREPFDLLASRIEERFSARQLDWPTATAIVGLVLLLGIAAEIANKFPAASDVAYAAALIIGFVAIGVQIYGIKGRFFRKKLFPPLGLALRSLKPTAVELEAVLKDMKAQGKKIGKELKLKSLVSGLGRCGVSVN